MSNDGSVKRATSRVQEAGTKKFTEKLDGEDKKRNVMLEVKL